MAVRKYCVEYVGKTDEKGTQNVKLSSPKGEFYAYLTGDKLDFKTHKGNEYEFELEWHTPKSGGKPYGTGSIVRGTGGSSPVSGDVQERIAHGQAVNCAVSLIAGSIGFKDGDLKVLVGDFYTLLTTREYAGWMGGASEAAGNADPQDDFPGGDDEIPF